MVANLLGTMHRSIAWCHGPAPETATATVVCATVGNPSPVTQAHHDTYGRGARMFEDMWAGRGCRRGGDRRGLSA